jgi:CII-binding regulator of phage lambda lysogenization HflD
VSQRRINKARGWLIAGLASAVLWALIGVLVWLIFFAK